MPPDLSAGRLIERIAVLLSLNLPRLFLKRYGRLLPLFVLKKGCLKKKKGHFSNALKLNCLKIQEDKAEGLFVKAEQFTWYEVVSLQYKYRTHHLNTGAFVQIPKNLSG